MKLLFIGDIVGKSGRRAVEIMMPGLVKQYGIDFVIANGENVAGGIGLTRDTARQLFQLGIDVLTMGNHVWDKRELLDFIQDERRIIRPANYPVGTPGRGWGVFSLPDGRKLAVANFCGRVFMNTLECPFRGATRLIQAIREEADYVLIDFHAEATSEKIAFGWHLAGQATAVLGTHTHVQTGDERILPGGTAYISDVGMTGPRDSVLGVKKELVLQKFLSQMPVRFEPATGVMQFNAVVVSLGEPGKAVAIERVNLVSAP